MVKMTATNTNDDENKENQFYDNKNQLYLSNSLSIKFIIDNNKLIRNKI